MYQFYIVLAHINMPLRTTHLSLDGTDKAPRQPAQSIKKHADTRFNHIIIGALQSFQLGTPHMDAIRIIRIDFVYVCSANCCILIFDYNHTRRPAAAIYLYNNSNNNWSKSQLSLE